MGGNWFSNDSTTSMKNKDNLHQKAHNSMTDFLMTKPWIELHKWCGDTIIIWLLTQTLLLRRRILTVWPDAPPPLPALSTAVQVQVLQTAAFAALRRQAKRNTVRMIFRKFASFLSLLINLVLKWEGIGFQTTGQHR